MTKHHNNQHQQNNISNGLHGVGGASLDLANQKARGPTLQHEGKAKRIQPRTQLSLTSMLDIPTYSLSWLPVPQLVTSASCPLIGNKPTSKMAQKVNCEKLSSEGISVPPTH